MVAVFSVLLTLTLTLLVTRIASLALVHTGLSREAADFQARSALTGTGFTTHEAESVVNHPVRRRIVLQLMLLGSIGIFSVLASVLASVLVTFLQPTKPGATLPRLLVLGVGIGVLWALAVSRWVDRMLALLVRWAPKHVAAIRVRDFRRLLGLEEGYAVAELHVAAGDWLADRTLRELGLQEEGVQVLGVQRADGPYRGAPDAETRIGVGDTVVLYGAGDAIEGLDDRLAGSEGDRAHDQAVQSQQAREQVDEARDREHRGQDAQAGGANDAGG